MAAGLVVTLAVGVFPAAPSSAHTFSRSDGNDSPGRLDIRSASVRHGSTSMIHAIRTYEGWTVQSLGDDSFFVVAIDTNRDQDFERCAIILKVRALRGALTNCGRQFIRSLNVAKPSGSTVNVKIPERQLGAYYRWAVFSYWTGPPAGCADTCLDAAPNGPPPILHDLTRPTVNLTSTPLRIWESATTSDFEFPFSVSDPESGLRSWKVQSRPVGGTVWTTVASGTSGGPKHPSIAGAPGRYTFRVVAEDRQGNRTTKSRLVYVPTDDADLLAEFSVAPTSTPDLAAFGATYSAMSSGSFTHTTEASECLFELIGPGTGDWWIQVSPTDGITTTIQDEDVDDLPRQTLYSDQTCGAEYVISLVSGTFGLDAVLG